MGFNPRKGLALILALMLLLGTLPGFGAQASEIKNEAELQQKAVLELNDGIVARVSRPGITLAYDKATVDAGKTFTVNVSISNTAGYDSISSGFFRLVYPSSFTYAGLFTVDGYQRTPNTNTNYLDYNMPLNANTTTNISLTFTAPNTATTQTFDAYYVSTDPSQQISAGSISAGAFTQITDGGVTRYAIMASAPVTTQITTLTQPQLTISAKNVNLTSGASAATFSVAPGEIVTYTLSVYNPNTSLTLKDVVVIDKFPAAGDTFILSGTTRGSQFEMAYYGPNGYNWATGTQTSITDNDFTAGVGSPTFTGGSPVKSARLSNVGGNTISIAPLTSQTFSIQLVVPQNPSGVAYNSFAVAFTPTANGSDLARQKAESPIIGASAPVSTTGTISGIAFIDNNGNGLRDADDLGQNGVTVALVDSSNTAIVKTSTTTTRSSAGVDGYYQFVDVAPGSYRVFFQKPTTSSGMVYSFSPANVNSSTIENSAAESTGYTRMLQVQAGSNYTSINAGFVAAGISGISGRVWIDADGTGIRTDTSEGMNGVKVELYDMQSLSTTPVSTTTTVTINNVVGCYNFTGINTGLYRIRVVLPDSDTISGSKVTYSFTEPNKTTDTSRSSAVSKSDGYTVSFSYTKDQVLSNINAGLIRTASATYANSVSGYVWYDGNSNGRRENGESYLSNVTVNLYLATDMTKYIKTTRTNSSGLYEFTNITPNNTYRVKISLPTAATQKFTLQNVMNDIYDSRVDSSGLSSLINMTSTTIMTNLNAGIAPKTTTTPTTPTETFPFIGAAKPREGDATVPMRQTTLTSAPIFKSIQPGDQVVVIGSTIDSSNRVWYKVLGYSYDGVIMKDLLTKVDESSLGLPRAARIFIPKDAKAPKAALRSEPRRAASIVGNLWMESGVSITIIGVEKGWYKITVSGMTGYIEPCQMRYAE